MATNENIKLEVSSNQSVVALGIISSNQRTVTLGADGGNPYYVGARAYVTQTDNGAVVTITDKEGTTTAAINNGETGADGVGILSIYKTGTVGLVDTYTITYTDGSTSTFDITNGQSGTMDYDELTNKPQIEGVTLSGNKTFPNLNLDALTNSEIQDIFDNLI